MIKFGVAGNSLSFYEEGHKHTEEAAKWCFDRGIDVFEYSFGKGVRMTPEKAKQIGESFLAYGIEMSAHAPYYINFANPDPEKIQNSVGYVLQTLIKLSEFGNGNRIVVHPATQGKVSREIAVEETVKNLNFLAESVIENGYSDKRICLETMGKLAQIGTLEEIVCFCNIAPFFYPCIDFGHLNARTFGSLKTSDDFEKIIVYMLENLPEEKVKNMHVHFSKIMFGASGEIKHLTFADEVYGPEFDKLAVVLKKYDLSPIIICESDGTQAEDSVTMKKIYMNL